jgi:hypothetical protein
MELPRLLCIRVVFRFVASSCIFDWRKERKNFLEIPSRLLRKVGLANNFPKQLQCFDDIIKQTYLTVKMHPQKS